MEFDGVTIDVNAEPATARLDAAALRAERQRLTLLAVSAPSASSPCDSELSRSSGSKLGGVGIPMPRWVPSQPSVLGSPPIESDTEVPLPGSDELVDIWTSEAVTPATDVNIADDDPSTNVALRRRCAELESEGFELRERLVEQEAALQASNSKITALEAELAAFRSQAVATPPSLSKLASAHIALQQQSLLTLPLTRTAVEEQTDELTPLSISPTTVNDDESLCGSCKAVSTTTGTQPAPGQVGWTWPEENVDVPKWTAPIFKSGEPKQLPPPFPRLTKLDGASDSVYFVPNNLKLVEGTKENPSPRRRDLLAPTVVSTESKAWDPSRRVHTSPRDDVCEAALNGEAVSVETKLNKQSQNVATDSDVHASEDHCITDFWTETEAATDLEHSATDAECTEAEVDDEMERMDHTDGAEDLEEEDQVEDDFFEEGEEEEDEYADSESSPRGKGQSLGISGRRSRRQPRRGEGVSSMTILEEDEADLDPIEEQDSYENDQNDFVDEEEEEYDENEHNNVDDEEEEDVYSETGDDEDDHISPRDGLKPRPSKTEVPVALLKHQTVKPESVESSYQCDWLQISSSPTPSNSERSDLALHWTAQASASSSASSSSRQPTPSMTSISHTANAIAQRIASLSTLPKTSPAQGSSELGQIDISLQRSYSAETKPGTTDPNTPPAPLYPRSGPAASPGRSPVSPGSLTTPRALVLPSLSESDLGQSPLSVRMVERRCPQNHALVPYICPPTDASTSFTCDMCKQSIATGSAVYGCRACNYDLCSGCMKQACASSPSHSLRSQTAQACQTWLSTPSQHQASLLVTSQTRPTTSGYPQRSVNGAYMGSSGANPNEAPANANAANAMRMRVTSAVVTPMKQRPEDVGRVISYGRPYAHAVAGSAYNAHPTISSLQRPHP